MILIEEDREDYSSGDYVDMFRDHHSGVGKTDGFNSEYSISKWEFRVKEHGGGQQMENYYDETSSVRGDSC